mmetsp:Transcript_1469/g.4651  ORF Transcript_1469/g.4651 Transcript_1469/m.4651 type:complete len:241 (-) Transcript_1469:878-1600(-)
MGADGYRGPAGASASHRCRDRRGARAIRGGDAGALRRGGMGLRSIHGHRPLQAPGRHRAHVDRRVAAPRAAAGGVVRAAGPGGGALLPKRHHRREQLASPARPSVPGPPAPAPHRVSHGRPHCRVALDQARSAHPHGCVHGPAGPRGGAADRGGARHPRHRPPRGAAQLEGEPPLGRARAGHGYAQLGGARPHGGGGYWPVSVGRRAGPPALVHAHHHAVRPARGADGARGAHAAAARGH